MIASKIRSHYKSSTTIDGFQQNGFVQNQQWKFNEQQTGTASKWMFTVEYRKNAHDGVPDALNRNLVKNPEEDGNNEIKFGHIASAT